MNHSTSHDKLEPLSKLHDITLPPAIGWWPLSPSLWMVIFMATAILVGIWWYFREQKKRNAYRQEALSQLQQIAKQKPPSEQIAAINLLLKQVALTAYPRQEVASLTSDKWVAFLQQRAGHIRQPANFAALLNLAYQPVTDDGNLHEAYPLVYRYAEQWIKRHHQ